MQENVYPQPPPFTWGKVEVRQTLPVYPPPEPLDYPSIPFGPRKPAFDAPYILSTHIIPASYLRTTRLAQEPKLPSLNLAKEDRKKAIAKVRQELDDLRTSKVTDGYPRILWNCINRYIRKGLTTENRTGVTLFFAHANGFPKEIWEPTLSYLLNSLPAAGIDEVWAWESVQHGDSGILNAKYTSGIFDWHDNGRDIANFFLHFLPTTSTADALPTNLARVPQHETDVRLQHGFFSRRLVAVGHSFGGCSSALAASLHPSLFTSLIMVDPVIVLPSQGGDAGRGGPQDLALGALARRDTWSSREEALESFKKNPFFSVWDPEVLKVYVECGIYETTDANGKTVAKLKMSGLQEAVVFTDRHTAYEVFDRVSHLDERISLRWVMPGKPGSPELGPPGSTRLKVWVRPSNSTNTTILGGGHLIPQEAPKELAQDLARYLSHILPLRQLSVPRAAL